MMGDSSRTVNRSRGVFMSGLPLAVLVIMVATVGMFLTMTSVPRVAAKAEPKSFKVAIILKLTYESGKNFSTEARCLVVPERETRIKILYNPTKKTFNCHAQNPGKPTLFGDVEGLEVVPGEGVMIYSKKSEKTDFYIVTTDGAFFLEVNQAWYQRPNARAKEIPIIKYIRKNRVGNNPGFLFVVKDAYDDDVAVCGIEDKTATAVEDIKTPKAVKIQMTGVGRCIASGAGGTTTESSMTTQLGGIGSVTVFPPQVYFPDKLTIGGVEVFSPDNTRLFFPVAKGTNKHLRRFEGGPKNVKCVPPATFGHKLKARVSTLVSRIGN